MACFARFEDKNDHCYKLIGAPEMTQTSSRIDKILIVDDDARIRDLLRRYLTQEGFEVFLAEDGKSLTRILLRESVDLIVLDLIMPGISGFDVVEALSERAETARIPVVVVTDQEITPEERLRLNGFVTSILDKTSFNPERLTTEVRRAMSGRREIA